MNAWFASWSALYVPESSSNSARPKPNQNQPSPNNPSFTQSVAPVPNVWIDTKYTINITTAKIGKPNQRFVTMLSILSETLSLPAFCFV